MAGAESRAGGPLTEYPATLSRDAKFLFTCCGAAVRVYSVHTGSLIQTLEGHTAGVSGACSFPDDAQHVYSFSLDGTIRKWAWEAGKLLQTYDVGFPIDAWVMVAGDAKAFYVATTKRVNKKVMTQEGDEKVQKRPGKVGRVEITAEGSTLTQLFEVSKIANFAAGKEWIAVSNKKKLTLYHVATKVTRVFRHPREVTALAFHPTEDYLITGEVNGSISRWQSLSVHERDEPIATNYHWHAHACHAVAFTPDGAYVLSGGEESVLVVWQLETGKKTFVPRIGRGPITNICVANDSSVYAVSLQDNGIHIINAFSMKQDQLIQGISNALLPIDWRPLVGFVQDPRTNCIVTNTYPGFASLQVYDVLRDAHVGDFEVEPQSVAIKGKAYEMRVEHIAFNADGSACATVDRYYSAYGSSAPCALKFWSRNSGQAFSFSLNSRTDAAHKAPITAIAYHPHMVVSAGQDRKFKVWVRIVRDKTRESNPTATPAYSWQCRSVGTYHNRNPEAVAFSTDGSLLAVSYGPVVTLWDPALNMLKHTLTQPHSEDPVRRVAFVPHSPYLVGHTDFDLVVWNLLTGGVWWSYRLHATALAVDTRTARFAVAAAADAHNADFLLVFNAADPKPVRITRFASGARLRELAWLADASAQSSALVYATSDRVFYVARDKPSLEAARSSLPVVSAATPSLLAQLVPELQAAEREAEAAHASLVPLVPQDCHPLPGLEDVPSHTLPPVQDLFDAFFDRMMALRADATAHADDGAEVTMSDVSKQSTKVPLYSIGSEGEAKTATKTTHAAEATSEPALEDDEAGDREAEEEAEEALFDFDEMVAFIKQMRIGGGGGADAAEAEAEAEASVPSATKSKKPKKKADDDSAPAAADSHADATHASAKTKGKRDAAAEATEPQAPSTPSKGRRNNAAAATAASADEVSAPPRKTPRRKGKGGEEDAEEAAASEAEAVAAATEAKTPRAKHTKETVAVAEAKTPRRRGKGDEEGAAAEAKTPAAHANGTSKAAADKEAPDTKTPRRRGRAAAALDDESQQTDEPHGGPRRSTRHAGHAAE